MNDDDTQDLFTEEELADIRAAAEEHHEKMRALIRKAVLDTLAS